MATLYISIILLVRVVQNICSKGKSLLFPKSLNRIIVFLAYTNLFSAVGALFFLVMEKHIVFSASAALVSALAGIFLVISSYCGLIAMQNGTMALSSMFATAGIIIPCIAGTFLFNEPLTPLQIAGLVLFLISAYLLTLSSKQAYKALTLKTFLFLLGSLVFEGAVMLMQKIYAEWLPGNSISMFSFFMFFIPCIGLFAASIFVKQEQPKEKLPKKLLLYGLIGAIAVLIINQLATLCAALVPSVVLFLMINGGNTIIAALVGIFVFKEKTNLKCAIGLALGILALALI